MKIAVIGATGMVGEVMLKVLAERNFPVTELIPVASERSVGKIVTYKGNDFKVVGLDVDSIKAHWLDASLHSHCVYFKTDLLDWVRQDVTKMA